MNTYDINSNEHILEPLIEKALLNSVKWTHNQCTGSPQEPDYVAALSTQFVKDLFHILMAVFPNYDFSVLGVYCHQKPIVNIGNEKPELGDILFAYADRKQTGKKVLNSLLLQAKMSKNTRSGLRINKNEKHQLKLYKEWPKFTYHRAGGLNGKTRNILPKTINDGAQYLLINDNPLTNGFCIGQGMFPMGCSVPDDILYMNDSLSKELINLLKFKSGRTFDCNPRKTKDGWSKMIWDLLKIAVHKYSKRTNAGLESFPRLNECVHFATEDIKHLTLLDTLIQLEEVQGGDENKIETADEDIGVSVVLIESQLKKKE